MSVCRRKIFVCLVTIFSDALTLWDKEYEVVE